jgi:hypothetical protein
MCTLSTQTGRRPARRRSEAAIILAAGLALERLLKLRHVAHLTIDAEAHR